MNLKQEDKTLSVEHNLQHISLALYQFMCHHIVGSEETIHNKRLLMAIGDNISCDEYTSIITSGSFGEGLEMKGSDIDYMIIRKNLQVYENISEIKWNPLETYFMVDTEETKPGFVKLQCLYSLMEDVIDLCVESKGVFYLSNQLVKSELKYSVSRYPLMNYLTDVIHGPCLSDKKGKFDFAVCIHLKTWIKQAIRWITRFNLLWPSDEVKSKIIEHGVLFVPVGVKGSPNEEIEWRISFSVGEKLLINSLTQTQLLCYALMKIILKDIINEDSQCKDLLCSYYIKNIMFWVSEELSFSCWKPHNLVSCFMQCFRRLIYCVEYSLCPHYFIPENNMFENRIDGHNRKVLLNKLNTLYVLDWRLILCSPQLQDFQRIPSIRYTESQLFVNYVEHMNISNVLYGDIILETSNNYSKVIKILQTVSSSKLKAYHLYHLSTVCQRKAMAVEFTEINNNRKTYKNYKLCQSYVLQLINHDAVSRWLYLATLFYKINQYRKALDILRYALSKCTQEKFYGNQKLSEVQREIVSSKTLQSTGLIHILKFLRLDSIKFSKGSTLIPRELELETAHSSHLIPPVVYAHFLSFLCRFHLGDIEQLRDSVEDLQLTISEKYFIHLSSIGISTSYNILGIAQQLFGDNYSARQAFRNAVCNDPLGLFSCAKIRLSMIDDD